VRSDAPVSPLAARRAKSDQIYAYLPGEFDIVTAWSIAHQATGRGKFAKLKNRRHAMAYRECKQLLHVGIEEIVGADDDGRPPLFACPRHRPRGRNHFTI
jgi:hypothetical protein